MLYWWCCGVLECLGTFWGCKINTQNNNLTKKRKRKKLNFSFQLFFSCSFSNFSSFCLWWKSRIRKHKINLSLSLSFSHNFSHFLFVSLMILFLLSFSRENCSNPSFPSQHKQGTILALSPVLMKITKKFPTSTITMNKKNCMENFPFSHTYRCGVRDKTVVRACGSVTSKFSKKRRKKIRKKSVA